MLKVKIIPALYGDCFMLSIEKSKSINILLDGGLAKTYNDFLKREILALKKAGEKIDLLINTHIDADHINGLIAFLNDNNKNNYIKVNEVWYNGLEQISSLYPESIFEEKCDEIDKKIIEEINNIGHADEFQQAEEIGSVQGVSFASLINQGKYLHNGIVNGKAIVDNISGVELDEGIRIQIIGPTTQTLINLEEEWLEELAKKNFIFSVPKDIKLSSTFEFMVARLKRYYQAWKSEITAEDTLLNYISDLENEDSSQVNASSISFVLEVLDKRYLFLGDAVVKDQERCEIINNIERLYGSEAVFEVIKLPHHGSNYNVSKDFIRLFKAKEYILSSNGDKFNHPDVDVIANILLLNKDMAKTLIFNYPSWQSELFNKVEWMEEYNYKLVVGDGENIIERIYG